MDHPSPISCPPRPCGRPPVLQATLTTLNPAENKRTYSSVHDDDAVGGPHARSMIDSAQAWSAKTDSIDQFMTINLGSVMAVKGVVTQGRADVAGSAQYVKTFKVEHSQDGSNWVKVTGTYEAGKQSSKVQAIFPAAVQAQYVKISVKSWNTHISMRAGVVLTEADSSAVLARKLGGHGAAPSSSIRSTVTTLTTTVPTQGTTGTTGATTTGTTGTTGATATGTTGGAKGTTGTTGKAETTGTTGSTGDPTTGTTGGGKGTTGTTGKAGTTGTTGTTGGGNTTSTTGTTDGVTVEQTAAASALFFPTMATILAVGAQLMF